MKRIIACVVLLVLTMGVSCNALAEWYSPYRAIWFDIDNVQCVNTETIKYWDYGGVDNLNGGVNLPYKDDPNQNQYRTGWDTSNRIYVYHTISGGGGNQYTNLFHAVKIRDDLSPYGVLCGQKWVTPAQWIPIQSNAIDYNTHYSVAVRGNTKHYENYGATSINFHIGVEANQ